MGGDGWRDVISGIANHRARRLPPTNCLPDLMAGTVPDWFACMRKERDTLDYLPTGKRRVALDCGTGGSFLPMPVIQGSGSL